MSKSMYSLILMDEVVKKIDEAAYREGTSRSNLVNQVLADYASVSTPYKRIEEILSAISRAAEQDGALQTQQTSASMLVLGSVLSYRYNPTIRYSVEFDWRKGYTCRFRSVSRSQSGALLGRLTAFYEMWCQIERFMHRDRPQTELRAVIERGRLSRTLRVEREGVLPDSQTLSEAIAHYIRLFDKALKLSFTVESGMDMRTFERITELYKQYLEQTELAV